MKDRQLAFDRSAHALYTRAAKKVIRTHLARHYAPDMAAMLWEDVQRIYVRFLDELPPCGGKKNRQCASIYNSLALLACYEAMPDKLSLEELEAMNHEVFVPGMAAMGFLSMNWPWVMRAEQRIFAGIARRGQQHRLDWPGNFCMEVEPYDPALGIRYRFTFCPLAEFARQHGYSHLMPALCNTDYPMLEALHGDLIRTTTCANGDYCDYWIVPGSSPHLAQHPRKRDAAGFLYNE